MADSRETAINELRRASLGEGAAHVWRSGNHPGMLMRLEFIEYGEELSSFDSGFSPEIDTKYETFYDGILSREEAAERLGRMLQAVEQ